MTNKQFHSLRLLQVIIPDIAALYCILDKAFGWGHISLAEACVPVFLSILGHITQYLSDEYFSTKSIVTKILPDKEEGTEEE